MFCPQCGANNADTAVVCVQCGRNLQPSAAVPLPAPGIVLPPGMTVQNYLVFAILATVFCCPATGIPAIIYAAQVNGKAADGRPGGSESRLRQCEDVVLDFVRSRSRNYRALLHAYLARRLERTAFELTCEPC